ncbi:MAG: hypothetical protein ACJ73D_11525 [Pyrinomonadaceae bacterium]
MKNQRTITITAAVFMLLGLAAFGFFRYLPQTVKAFNPQPDPPGYGLVGITNGQTVRVSVVNTGLADPNLPPDPCRVVMTFREAEGNLFRNADGSPVRRIALLKGGESVSLELNADNFTRSTDGAGRLQLRPVVQIQQPDGTNQAPPDPCIPGVEVFNNANGRTQFMMPFLPAIQRTAPPS